MVLPRPFDAVLIISFGGPQRPEDIRPFLANVLRGRRVPPARVEQVVRQYELFGGVSPITELTFCQAKGLRERLSRRGPDLPVYVGMRNWHPLLSDTLQEMAEAGVRRAIGFITAAHRSYSSCLQYKENLADARRELLQRRQPDIEVTYVGDWHTHPGFIQATADHVRQALAQLPDPTRARLVFTAHSIPQWMARMYPYERQIRESAALVARATGTTDHVLAYQSRSGHPEDPWLEPDIRDYLRAEHARGLQAVVISPIGFVYDHMEVLYDLDHDAAAVCREIELPMARARTAGNHPAFLDAIVDLVRSTYEQYATGRPLPLVPAPEAA